MINDGQPLIAVGLQNRKHEEYVGTAIANTGPPQPWNWYKKILPVFSIFYRKY